MSFPARLVTVFAAAFLLVSCASSKVDEARSAGDAQSAKESREARSTGDEQRTVEARNAVAAGSQFSRELYHGYLDLAEQELSESDHIEANYFSEQALKSAAGEAPEPVGARERDLPREIRGEAIASRARLMYSLSHGAKENKPKEAARAQIMFDCWMQEQEENAQPEHIRECRQSFIFAIAALEGKRQPRTLVAEGPGPGEKVPGEPVQQEQVAEIPPDTDQSKTRAAQFVLYFPFDKHVLTPSAGQVVKELVEHLKGSDAKRVDIAGHADRSGEVPYNQNLSMQRAQTVAKALEEAGVDQKLFTIVAMGENLPAEPTPDGVRNPQNRRVEIHISSE